MSNISAKAIAIATVLIMAIVVGPIAGNMVAALHAAGKM